MLYNSLIKKKGLLTCKVFIFTSTKKIFLFFNIVFSDAIEKAWIDDGMLNALRSLEDKPFV